MILLDAYAVIALLGAERSGEQVRDLMREEPSGIGVVQLSETVDVLSRRYRVAPERTRAAVRTLGHAGLSVLALDEPTSWRAGETRARLYHRARTPLSLADCVLLASASPDDRVATADRHLLAAAESQGTATVSLGPASSA